MKKIILVILSLITLQANAQFRGMEWGSSKKDALAKFGKPYIEDDAYIAYEYTLAGKSVLSVLRYKQDKLYRAEYILDEKHTNKNDYIADYKKFKELLSKKYGDPKEDEIYWRDDLYKDDYSGWGMAVSIGHLIQYSTWINEKTDIECAISGDNYKITVKITYRSVELKEWSEKVTEETQLDDF